MGRKSSARRLDIWRTDGFWSALAGLAVVALCAVTGVSQRLDLVLYDAATRASSPAPCLKSPSSTSTARACRHWAPGPGPATPMRGWSINWLPAAPRPLFSPPTSQSPKATRAWAMCARSGKCWQPPGTPARWPPNSAALPQKPTGRSTRTHAWPVPCSARAMCSWLRVMRPRARLQRFRPMCAAARCPTQAPTPAPSRQRSTRWAHLEHRPLPWATCFRRLTTTAKFGVRPCSCGTTTPGFLHWPCSPPSTASTWG